MPSDEQSGGSSPSSCSPSIGDQSGSGSGPNNSGGSDGSGNANIPILPTIPDVPIVPTVPVVPPITIPTLSIPGSVGGSVAGSVVGSVSGPSSSLSSSSEIPPIIVPIVVVDASSVVHGVGYDVVTQNGTGADGTDITRVTFDTTEPDLYDPQIRENLSEVIEQYNDITEPNSQAIVLLNQIKAYAGEIQCSDFHGKGTIDDYTVLFQAASRIATDTKQMELNIDIEGFNDFAQAADELSELFNGFITKLQNVNIITDITFLTSISIALGKIVNLSNIFGKFKKTVVATTKIQIPKSAHDTKVVIEGVMDEINCAMQYINYFVSPTDQNLVDAQLSAAEKNIIAQSVNTINSWNVLCEQGVSIAMSSDVDVQYIQNASTELKQTTVNLKNATSTLKSKLAAFNIMC